MKTVDEIRSILSAHREVLRARFGVKEIGIFGSLARNEAERTSDVDIVVDFERPIGLAFTELAEYLETILDAKVDLVSKHAIKPRFLAAVESDLIYV
jgi:predicted nucleotidyltransferase